MIGMSSMPLSQSSSFANYTAGNFLSGIPRRVGTKIIGITVNNYSPSNNLVHTKAICFYGQVCVFLAT